MTRRGRVGALDSGEERSLDAIVVRRPQVLLDDGLGCVQHRWIQTRTGARSAECSLQPIGRGRARKRATLEGIGWNTVLGVQWNQIGAAVSVVRVATWLSSLRSPGQHNPQRTRSGADALQQGLRGDKI